MNEFKYIKHMSGDADRQEIVRDLMDAYGKDVWNFAYSLIRDPDAADDLTQNTFLKVYEKLDSFRGQSHVKTWILSITRHQAYDLRRSAFWKKVTLVSFVFDDHQPPVPSAESIAIDKVAANEVWEQVLRLPVKYREVLVLSAHHELSYAEIAKLLQISEGTVKSRLYRARTKMQSLLERRESYAK